MALMTTVEVADERYATRTTPSTTPRTTTSTTTSGRNRRAATAGRDLDVLVGRVLASPDDVPEEVMAAAVRGLEALGGASLGTTTGDARVVLQRRFGRALGRSGWSTRGA